MSAPPAPSAMDAMSPQGLLDDLASRLTPDASRALVRWAEDRLGNAITPLHLRLQMHGLPGVMGCDPVYREAERTVARILEILDELRGASRGASDGRFNGPQKALDSGCEDGQ